MVITFLLLFLFRSVITPNFQISCAFFVPAFRHSFSFLNASDCLEQLQSYLILFKSSHSFVITRSFLTLYYRCMTPCHAIQKSHTAVSHFSVTNREYSLFYCTFYCFCLEKAKRYYDSRSGVGEDGPQPPLIRISSGPAEILKFPLKFLKRQCLYLSEGLLHAQFGWFKAQVCRIVTEERNNKRQKTWSLRCRSWRDSDRWCCKMASSRDIYKIALWEFQTANQKALTISPPLLIEILVLAHIFRCLCERVLVTSNIPFPFPTLTLYLTISGLT